MTAVAVYEAKMLIVYEASSLRRLRDSKSQLLKSLLTQENAYNALQGLLDAIFDESCMLLFRGY